MESESDWTEYRELVLSKLTSQGDRLDEIDRKLDNHITHIEHRLTKIEANHRNVKWILGLIFVVMVGIFGTVLANYVG